MLKIQEPVTRTEMQVQEEMDKKRFSTSAPHVRGATPYTETVEYQDMIYLTRFQMSQHQIEAM